MSGMDDVYNFVGMQAMQAMFAFLDLEGSCDYTARDREALYRDLDWMATACSQPTAGQKRGVDFHDMPFVNARIAANAMRLRMSGLLDGLEG